MAATIAVVVVVVATIVGVVVFVVVFRSQFVRLDACKCAHTSTMCVRRVCMCITCVLNIVVIFYS